MSGHYPREVIDRVRESVDIVDIISSYLKLKKSGANYQALCPFHQEKSPSFSVSSSKQIFHCFGCGEGGNVISFVMKYDNLTFIDALKTLADRGGVALPQGSDYKQEDYSLLYDINREASLFFSEQLRLASPESFISTYLTKRSLTAELVERFGIGFAPDKWDSLYNYLTAKKISPAEIEKAGLIKKSSRGNYIDTFRDRLIFPIMDEKGRAVAFGGRALGEDVKGPKYLNSPETPIYRKGRILYGLDKARDEIKKKGNALIVEGYMDLVALSRAGINNVVATSGTAFTEFHGRILKRYTENFVMVFDGDDAGRKAAERATAVAMVESVRPKITMMPTGMDPDDVISERGPEGIIKIIEEAKPYISYILDTVCKKFDVSTAEGKADAARALLPELASIVDPIERAGAVEALSSRVGIPAARIEMRLPRQKGDRFQPESKKEPVNVRPAPLEKIIIRIMIDHPEAIASRLPELQPEDFRSVETRKAFEALSAEIGKGVIDGNELIEKMEDYDIGEYMRSLMMKDSLYEEEAWGDNVDNFINHLRQGKSHSKMVRGMLDSAKSSSREKFLERQKDFRDLH